jgi:long-chain acyl-CoA synthetase
MNLAHIVDAHPGDAAALIDEAGRVTTYGHLRRATEGLRARLDVSGVGPGDRVAIVSANHPAFAAAYLAVLGLGAVAVPLNPSSPAAELGGELARVRVAALLTGPGGEGAPSGLDRADLGAVPHLDAAEATAAETSGGPPIVDREPDDLAVLLFTAGTSGSPRPAMLTHHNLLANLDQVQRHPGRSLIASDVSLGVLPLFHIFGLNVLLGGSLLVGASILLLDRFEAGSALDLIERRGVTILMGAPTMYAALAALPARPDDKHPGPSDMPSRNDVEHAGPGDKQPSPGDKKPGPLDGVRLAFSGAAPLAAEVADACQRRFGLTIRQGYGLTEAAPVVTSSVISEAPRRGSIGVPLPGLEVRLVDEEDEEALGGDPGEIWVRGPNVFPGYWEDPKATEAVLTADGWLRTGDIAVMGDDGELYIVDRAKDLIIVSGFNIFPAEVEDILLGHPGVAEVAVVGEADPVRGESVHAFVVATGSAGEPPTADELIGYCGERLARYKCPTEITFVASLPHGLGGKLLRRVLRGT